MDPVLLDGKDFRKTALVAEGNLIGCPVRAL
jgi:hypothetical protein